MLKLDIRAKLLKVLSAAAKERSKRQNWIRTGTRTEIGWVIYEREQMYFAVNQERSTRGLPPVTMKDIERVEQTATGHVDYAEKFALYCAELVLGS